MTDLTRRSALGLLGVAALGSNALGQAADDSTKVPLPSSAAPPAPPRIGQPAPEFRGLDTKEAQVNLSDFKGRHVVLEWTNHDCPFVKKVYGSDTMQALQRKWTGQNVAWLSIISSSEGEQGHVGFTEADKLTSERKAAPTAVLIDTPGEIGRLYDARTTPHMFIIKPDGVLAYMGAIDDKPSSDPASLQGATNYVDQALTELTQGRPVTTASTKPYGCSVKYRPS